RRHRGSFQSQAGADLFLQFGSEVRENSYRPRELSHPHVFGGSDETVNIALGFGIPVGDFESEGDGLSVDAVRAPHHGSVLELPGPALENFGQALEILRDNLG